MPPVNQTQKLLQDIATALGDLKEGVGKNDDLIEKVCKLSDNTQRLLTILEAERDKQEKLQNAINAEREVVGARFVHFIGNPYVAGVLGLLGGAIGRQILPYFTALLGNGP